MLRHRAGRADDGGWLLALRSDRPEVVDQVAEDDRVASRFVLSGSNRGRQVRLWGIVISRMRDGRIVEDWSAFDSLELLKQLGLLRTLLAAPRMLGAMRDARAS
jgi:SnoaL-like polyketide cyclase